MLVYKMPTRRPDPQHEPNTQLKAATCPQQKTLLEIIQKVKSNINGCYVHPFLSHLTTQFSCSQHRKGTFFCIGLVMSQEKRTPQDNLGQPAQWRDSPKFIPSKINLHWKSIMLTSKSMPLIPKIRGNRKCRGIHTVQNSHKSAKQIT